jgi:hypothetical protein
VLISYLFRKNIKLFYLLPSNINTDSEMPVLGEFALSNDSHSDLNVIKLYLSNEVNSYNLKVEVLCNHYEYEIVYSKHYAPSLKYMYPVIIIYRVYINLDQSVLSP